MAQKLLHNTKAKLLLSAFLLMGVVALLSGCQDDSPVEEAAEEISEGVEDASEELDPDRTMGEKVGDAIEDAGEEIQDAAE